MRRQERYDHYGGVMAVSEEIIGGHIKAKKKIDKDEIVAARGAG